MDVLGSNKDVSGAMPDGGFARYLSQADVWGIAFGCIVGWDAFVMPGTTFLPIAGPLGTTIAMCVSAVIMLIIGKNYAYLMNRRPGTGGVYAYTKETLGRDHAFLCSWFLSLSYTSIVFLNATALFVISRTLFGSMLQFGPCYQIAGYQIYLSEIALSTAALVIIGALFISQKPFLQRLQVTLAFVLMVGSVIVTAICLLSFGKLDQLTSFGIGGQDPVPAIATIILLAPWAFVGFDVVSLETAHFKFDVRKSGKIIALSILCGAFVYTGMALVSVCAAPGNYSSWQEYVANLDSFSGVEAVPTFYAARSAMGNMGLVLLGATALAAIFTGIIGAYRSTTRMLSTMAEDGIVPETFSSTPFCILFIMAISISVSFLGRNALNWFVELTTFGAIVGFGYSSISTFKLARAENSRTMQITGILGTIITLAFLVVEITPRITILETMGAESFLMLALWCLLGFVFYWKTMSKATITEHSGRYTSSIVLFSLLLYSSIMWYVLNLLKMVEGADTHAAIIKNTVILLGITLTGLMVMLYVQNMLHRRQEELEREVMRVEEGNRAKSQFLFNMSHDIRTPMNAIIGLTALAKGEDVSSEQKDDYLDRIEHAGQQLLSIINDVLDMSRIESGKLELFPELTDLRRVVRGIDDLFRAQMEDKGINFEVDTISLDDPWVLCDQNRLNRVLLNLVSNAYKFTNKGGSVRIAIEQVEHSADGSTGTYKLHVQDTGIGMSGDFAESMFVPFERERTSTVSKTQGTGLGLSITKSIVDLMGGSIDVITEPEKGTEFVVTFALPIEEEPEAALRRQEEAVGEVDLSDLHVLLVEDIPVNRQIAEMILQQHGCVVDTAENGLEAVKAVEKSGDAPFDVVLMDIQMPVMDGYEATRQIRALEVESLAATPIIAMTANAFREDEIAAENAGMQGHIAKPLEVEKMLGTIVAVLRSNTSE